VVELCPADLTVVGQQRDRFADELNREWRAMADAEGWSAPEWVRVEVIGSDAGVPQRPCLTVAYHRPRGDGGPTVDATPVGRGPYLVTPDNLRVALPPGDPVTVGRGQADVLVDRRFVSRVHAVLTAHADGGVEVRDLDSANKTYVDGVEVEPARPVVVRSPAKIGLGRLCVLSLRWPS
jgi:hypothetical protein